MIRHRDPRRLLAVASAAVMLSACGGSAAPSTGGGSASSSAAAPTPGATTSAAAAVPDAVLSHQFSWGTFKLAKRIADKLAAGQSISIVVQNQGTAIPVFGAQQKTGVDRGAKANTGRLRGGITARLAGPATTDQTGQLTELETLLTSAQVDCLGVQSPSPDAFVDPINKYIDAGIPVFTENTDVPNSKRFAFYALNEESSGKANGEQTANLVKAGNLSIDTIATGSGLPQAPWAQGREKGFIEGYKSVSPSATFFNDEKNGLPTGENFTTQEVVDSVGPFLTGNPKVNLFFHTDQGVGGVAKVIADKNLTGKVFTSGFNVSPEILDGLDNGQILVTIDQGFDNQAEAVVKACVDYLLDGTVPADPLAYLKPIIVTKAGGDGLMSAADARARLAEATKS